MTPGMRHDLIRFGCAFVGAIAGRLIVAPTVGGPPFVWSLLGAGIFWIAARMIMRAAELRRNVVALEVAEAHISKKNTDITISSKSHHMVDPR